MTFCRRDKHCNAHTPVAHSDKSRIGLLRPLGMLKFRRAADETVRNPPLATARPSQNSSQYSEREGKYFSTDRLTLPLLLVLLLLASAHGDKMQFDLVESFDGQLCAISPHSTYFAYLGRKNNLQIVSQRKREQIRREWLDNLFDMLDSDRFRERNDAYSELQKLGALIEPELTEQLNAAPSLEANYRLKALLRRIELSAKAQPWRRVRKLVFTPNEELVALAGEDRTVSLWRSLSLQPDDVVFSFDTTIYSLAFSNDGHWMAVGLGNGQIMIYDFQRRAFNRKFSGHTSTVTGIEFSADNTVLYSAGGFDKRIGIWDLRNLNDITDQRNRHIRWLEGHKDSIRCIALSPNQKFLASGGYEKEIYLWDVARNDVVSKFSGHGDSVRAATFSHDGEMLVSGGDDKYVIAWDVASKQEIGRVHAKVDKIESISLASDTSQMIVSGNNGKSTRWKLKFE